MNIQEGYQALLSIQERRKIDLDSFVFRYFQERGLTHSLIVQQYNGITDLLIKHRDLSDRISKLINEKSCLNVDIPLIYGEDYERLSKRINSKLFRFFCPKSRLKRDEEKFMELKMRYDSDMQRARNRIFEVSEELSEIQPKIIATEENLEGLILSSGAMIFCTGIGKPKDKSPKLGWYTFFYNDIDKYFQTSDGNYTAITKEGEKVVQETKKRKLENNQGFDFDLVTDMVKKEVPILWDFSENPHHKEIPKRFTEITRGLSREEVSALIKIANARTKEWKGHWYTLGIPVPHGYNLGEQLEAIRTLGFSGNKTAHEYLKRLNETALTEGSEEFCGKLYYFFHPHACGELFKALDQLSYNSEANRILHDATLQLDTVLKLLNLTAISPDKF